MDKFVLQVWYKNPEESFSFMTRVKHHKTKGKKKSQNQQIVVLYSVLGGSFIKGNSLIVEQKKIMSREAKSTLPYGKLMSIFYRKTT